MQSVRDASPEMRRSHASTGVIFRIVNGLVYFVAFVSRDVYKGQTKTAMKFPTETWQPELNETPWETMLTGLDHEVADQPGDLVFRSFITDDSGQPQSLIVIEFPSDAEDGSIHAKFVFLLEIEEGDESCFRVKVKGEHDGTKLDPPRFIEARDLLSSMMERSPDHHIMALVRSLNYLARDPVVFENYRDIVLGELDEDHKHFIGSAETAQFFFLDEYLRRKKRENARKAKTWKPRSNGNGHGHKH